MKKNKNKAEDCEGKDWKYSHAVTTSHSLFKKYCCCKEPNGTSYCKCCRKSIKVINSIDNIIEKDYKKHKKIFDKHRGIDGDKLEEIINPAKQDPSVDLIIGLKGRENNDKRLLFIECKFKEGKPWAKSGKDCKGYRAKYDKYDKIKPLLVSEIRVCKRYIILCNNEGRQVNYSKQEENIGEEKYLLCFYSPKRLYDKYFK